MATEENRDSDSGEVDPEEEEREEDEEGEFATPLEAQATAEEADEANEEEEDEDEDENTAGVNEGDNDDNVRSHSTHLDEVTHENEEEEEEEEFRIKDSASEDGAAPQTAGDAAGDDEDDIPTTPNDVEITKRSKEDTITPKPACILASPRRVLMAGSEEASARPASSHSSEADAHADTAHSLSFDIPVSTPPLVKVPQINFEHTPAEEGMKSPKRMLLPEILPVVPAFEKMDLIGELTEERESLLGRIAELEAKEAQPSSMVNASLEEKLQASLEPETTTSEVDISRLLDLQSFQDILQNVMLVASGGDAGYFEIIDGMSTEDGTATLGRVSRQLLSLASSNFRTHQRLAEEYRTAQDRFEQRLQRAVNDAFATPRSPRHDDSMTNGDMTPRIDLLSSRDLSAPASYARSICRTPRQYIEYALTPRNEPTPSADTPCDQLAMDTPRVLPSEEEYEPMMHLARVNNLYSRLLTRELQEHILTKNSLARVKEENTVLVSQLQERETELLEKETTLSHIREELGEAGNCIADLRLEVESVDKGGMVVVQKELRGVKEALLAQQRQAADREASLISEIDKMQADLLQGLERLLSIEEGVSTTPTLSPALPPAKPRSIWISSTATPSPPKKVGILATELRSLCSAIRRRSSSVEHAASLIPEQ